MEVGQRSFGNLVRILECRELVSWVWNGKLWRGGKRRLALLESNWPRDTAVIRPTVLVGAGVFPALAMPRPEGDSYA